MLPPNNFFLLKNSNLPPPKVTRVFFLVGMLASYAVCIKGNQGFPTEKRAQGNAGMNVFIRFPNENFFRENCLLFSSTLHRKDTALT